MVDTKTPGDKTLSVPSKTLTLKPRVEQGTVRQSFSHGRTKQVVVEKRGKRRIGGDAPASEAPPAAAPEPVVTKAAAPAARAPLSRPAPPAAPRRASGVVLPTLTKTTAAPAPARWLRPGLGISKSAAPRRPNPPPATARKASSRPSAGPQRPAARPRKNVTAPT